jgi:hypothetical protein
MDVSLLNRDVHALENEVGYILAGYKTVASSTLKCNNWCILNA